MLCSQGKKWSVAATREGAGRGGRRRSRPSIEVHVDPRAEWRQMYREVWRLERDFLYAPNFHGLDLKAAERVYAPFVEGIASREDLNQLFREMTGNLDGRATPSSAGGCAAQAGAASASACSARTIASSDGRYQFARILAGENWNPKLQAPLTQPGVNVKAGEFLLAVNGQDLRGDDDVYRLFQGTAGQQTVLTVGPSADGARSRQVTVVPVASEDGAAPAHLDGGQPPQGGRADGRPRGLRLHPGHLRRRLRELQPLLLRAGRQGGGRSSTSASTTAAPSPTTSWTT